MKTETRILNNDCTKLIIQRLVKEKAELYQRTIDLDKALREIIRIKLIIGMACGGCNRMRNIAKAALENKDKQKG